MVFLEMDLQSSSAFDALDAVEGERDSPPPPSVGGAEPCAADRVADAGVGLEPHGFVADRGQVSQ